ncbi:AAA domain-containing protein [Saccharothrix sp. NRRL B-16314]|uniref:AAA domain-containing protein n=1 Tax=Saccharothrix sp. NRRL B-16314 TaxID=1463825 RepID=UPI0006908EDC|nr:AAA domain-containing protein [Saccharothrix sp. NRRL B-16314]
MTVPAVLRTLARLSASEQPARVQLDLTKTAGLVWMGTDETAWGALTATQDQPRSTHWTARPEQQATVERLASFDALHQEDRLLRLGWAFLCGPTTVNGQRRRVCLPLVSRPVRLHHVGGRRYQFHVAGDVAMFPLLADWSKAAELETRLARGEEWIKATLAAGGLADAGSGAGGLADVPVLGPEHDPRVLIGGDELVVVAGAGLHAGEPVVSTERGAALYSWARTRGIEQTALAGLYSSSEDTGSAGDDTASDETGAGEVTGALALSPSQRTAVLASRAAPVTVVGGPPGSGKTHTLAAIALDAVASGRSVLLASRTRNAADVLGDALRRAGGPVPVLFGDSELRQEMARELGTGLAATSAKGQLARLDHARKGAIAAVARIERALGEALRDEELVDAALRFQALMPGHRSVAPRAFEDGVDFNRLHGLLRPRHGLFGHWRTQWAVRSARRLAGAADDVDAVDLEAAVLAAEQSAAQVRVVSNGGTSTASLRGLLAEEDDRSHTAIAAWLAAVAVSRRGAGPRRAVAALATSLRSGRAARRRALAGISTEHLVQALPLWVGTLADVEDILPAVPGMFDLVVIDEASHVDQPLAAPALLRGRRAVIGGDPRQLRHVSFVGDHAVREALTAEGTVPLADRLDVPKVSLFDAGAAVAGVHWLTEHHRCAPHLIGFAATRFYEGRIALLTTHPSIADVDCIDVERVAGVRDDKGVNEVEVDAVLAHLRRRIAAGVRSIGVVTPFRAQADALEQALLDRLSLDEITTGGVRVGTVHGVQGSEFDEVVISLALTDEDRPAAWRFANDRNLLAVLTTRARRLVHVITSAGSPVGLLAEYLRHAERPPDETEGVPPSDDWTLRLATELTGLGLTTRTGYPVGQWRVDVVVGERTSAVALDTRPHPDGTAAHLARWRALRGAGWRIHDAFPSRFDHDPARAAVELAQELSHRPAHHT